MDYKRNTGYFSKSFAKNMLILAILGGTVAVVGGFVWWYIYYSIVIEILAIAGAITAIAALSQRPSDKSIFEQIETAQTKFHQVAMEALGDPADAQTNSCVVWGFVPGTAEKVNKDGKKITDRVEFSLIYLHKGEVRIYRQTVSLLTEESAITDTKLSLQSLTVTLQHDTHTLMLTTPDKSIHLSVYEPDYRLEEFVEAITYQQSKER